MLAPGGGIARMAPDRPKPIPIEGPALGFTRYRGQCGECPTWVTTTKPRAARCPTCRKAHRKQYLQSYYLRHQAGQAEG